MQATGDSFHPMIVQMSGAITNIILDPIFIFTFRMGVAGAAIATVIGQIVSMVLALYFVRKNQYIKLDLSPRTFRPDGKIIAECYKVGVPTIIMNSVSTVMVSGLNSILISFSTTAVSVLGVYFKLQSFVFMPVFGLQAGTIPIIAFNYGARNKKRMTKTIKVGCAISLIILSCGLAVFQIAPDLLLSFFAASDEMLAIGMPALRIVSLCFIPAAISIALTASFQATGVGWAAMVVSIVRQLAFLLPIAYLLSLTGVLNDVWLAFFLADLVGLTLSICFYLYVYKSKIKPLEAKQA